jgi:hypothetical protein
VVCAPLARPPSPRRGKLRRNLPAEIPKDPDWSASREHHPEVTPLATRGSATPASWSAVSGQTVIVLTGTAGTRSEDRMLLVDPEIGESTPKRRGCGWGRTSHLWW